MRFYFINSWEFNMENFVCYDIQDVVNDFWEKNKDEKHRYRSFDFCYSHFYFSKINNKIDIEKSCYVLWSYLASWGMLRGSSFLLQKNPFYLKDLVEYIYSQDISVWEIDVDGYNDNIERILNLYENVKERVILNAERELVLVTKILLGVFAIIPAYDTYFCETFRQFSDCKFRKFNKASLEAIHEFYLANKDVIDELQTQEQAKVCNFNGDETSLKYTKAKIIDMYGFEKKFFGR